MCRPPPAARRPPPGSGPAATTVEAVNSRWANDNLSRATCIDQRRVASRAWFGVAVAVAVGAFVSSAWLYTVTAVLVVVGVAVEIWNRTKAGDDTDRPIR